MGYDDITISSKEFLEHFGVKGMKWGVRRESKGSESKPSFTKAHPTATAIGVSAAALVAGHYLGKAAVHLINQKPMQRKMNADLNGIKRLQETLSGAKSAANLFSSPSSLGRAIPMPSGPIAFPMPRVGG